MDRDTVVELIDLGEYSLAVEALAELARVSDLDSRIEAARAGIGS